MAHFFANNPAPTLPEGSWCHANTDTNHWFSRGEQTSAVSLCGAVTHPGEIKTYGTFGYCDACVDLVRTRQTENAP